MAKTKKQKKRLKPRNIRNKHAKQTRELLKKARIKVSAKQIYCL